MSNRRHIAFIAREFAEPLLDGQKTIESRFMKTRRAPFGIVRPGDLIFFKISGGPVVGAWSASWVRQFAELSPDEIGAIARRFNDRIRAPAEYWYERRNSRYGVLIGLVPSDGQPQLMRVVRQFGNAWMTTRTRIAARATTRTRAKKRAG